MAYGAQKLFFYVNSSYFTRYLTADLQIINKNPGKILGKCEDLRALLLILPFLLLLLLLLLLSFI